MKLETQLERLIACIQRQGAVVDEIANPADRLSVSLPYPRLFGELLAQHSFTPFELGGIRVFSNIKDEEDNLECLLADAVLTRTLVKAGFLPFGRPVTGSYDRVCFDVRGVKQPLDAPVVLMEHEAVLSHNHIPQPKMLAGGITELVAKYGAPPKLGSTNHGL